jgi:hypothetical protein
MKKKQKSIQSPQIQKNDSTNKEVLTIGELVNKTPVETQTELSLKEKNIILQTILN